MWDTVFPYVAALLPTVAVGLLFYFVIKAILEGDRRERLAQSKWDRQHEKPIPPATPENSADPSGRNSSEKSGN